MIKASPNYPLCISARPGPFWCVCGLFWKRDKLTSAKIFADVCSRMRGVIPVSPPEKFFLGFFIRSSAFNLSTCSSRFAYSRRFPGRRLQPHCPWLCPPPQNFAELPSLGHLVPGYARFSLWKIFHGPGGKALCGENICLCSETALYKYVG